MRPTLKSDPRHSLAWLKAGVALAALAPLAFALGAAWLMHRDAEYGARLRLEDMTRAMERHAVRSFDTYDVVLQEVLRVLGRQSKPLAKRARELNGLLLSIRLRVPEIRSLAVRDAVGALVAGNSPEPLASPPASGFAGPLRSDPATGELYFVVGRALDDDRGERVAAVELAVDPAHFVRHWRTLAKPEREIAFRLIAADGAVLARFPGEMQPGLRLGDSRAPAEPYTAVREVGSYPAFVIAGQAPDAVFAAWREQIALLGAITAPVTLALVLASLLALARTRRALDMAERLQAESEQRVRAEEALRHAQKMEALGELTGGVAHDFNNLMMVVSNNAQLLARRHAGLVDSRELAAIRRALDSGSRLTRQLLAFARRQPLLPEIVDLSQALPAMRALLETTAGTAVRIALDVAAGTPAVLVDRSELEMALINLIANARDAMNGAGEIDVEARSALPGEGPAGERRYVVVSVLDNGHGVPAEDRDRVFDPFFTTKPPGIGTGLGLSQVYGFCTQAGGKAILASEVGVGTTVSMFLPAAESAPALADVSSTASGGRALDAKKLLLVEDNRDVANALASLLAGMGCRVTTLASAEEAERALAAGEHFDVALSDIVMPGSRDGISLALALRERRTPVVLMTGYSKETERARAAGIDVLRKPCAPAEIADALARALASAPSATPR